MRRPSFQFYPADYLQDRALRACSLPARGLWMDMLCFMHQGTPYGYLTLPAPKDTQEDVLRPMLSTVLARMVGSSTEEVESLLDELEAAGVFSRTSEGVIYSRRMVQDERVREVRAAGGVRSLDNPNVPRAKDRGKDTSQESFRPSPSSSSSSSSSSPETDSIGTVEAGKATPVPEKSSGFNSTEVSRALCSENGWSGEKMIWAFRDAIEFQSKQMPEASLEQVGQWLVKAYFERKSAMGDYAGGPQKFFEQALYRGSSTQAGGGSAETIADNPATRAQAQLEEKEWATH